MAGQSAAAHRRALPERFTHSKAVLQWRPEGRRTGEQPHGGSRLPRALTEANKLCARDALRAHALWWHFLVITS